MFSLQVKEAYGQGFIMHAEKKSLKFLKHNSKNASKEDMHSNEELVGLNALK